MIYKKYEDLKWFAAANIRVLWIRRLYMIIWFIPISIAIFVCLSFLFLKEILLESFKITKEAVTAPYDVFKNIFLPSWSGKDLNNDQQN